MPASQLPERLAVLDIGSLTVRAAVAESVAPGSISIICRRQEITALGERLAERGRLSPEAMNRTEAAAAAIVKEWQGLRVGRCQAVATQAVRQAENGAAFLNALKTSLHLPVTLLTSAQEASLTLEGVLAVLSPKFREAAELVVFDLGGGSCEFMLVRGNSEPIFAGLPLGVLTVSQSHPVGDPPQPEAVSSLRQKLQEKLGGFVTANFSSLLSRPPVLVGTAGAVTTLAAMSLKMMAYEPDRINNLVLSRNQLDELTAILAGLPESERARLPGLNAARAGVMVAGALLVLAILQAFSQDFLVVSDAGLLEGLLSRLSKIHGPRGVNDQPGCFPDNGKGVIILLQGSGN